MFPTVSAALSTFTGTNGTSPVGFTTDPFGWGDQALVIQGNQVTGSSGNFCTAYWNAVQFGPDVEVYFDIATKPPNGELAGLIARLQSPGGSGADCYTIELVPASGTDQLTYYRVDNTVFTQLGAAVSQEFSNGERMGLEIIGSSLQAYRFASSAWAAVSTPRSDSTYPGAGYTGLDVFGNTVRLDNYVAGTRAAGGTQYQQSVGGTLGLSGTLVKQPRKLPVGTLPMAGSLIKQTRRVLTGTLGLSGALAGARTLTATLVGTMGLSGSLFKRPGKVIDGTLPTSGTLNKQTRRALTGTLDLSGVLTGARALFISLVGTLGLSGAVTKQAQKPVDGTLPTSGSLVKQTRRALTGTLGLSGSLSGIRALFISLVGTLGLSGTLTKRTDRSLSGTLPVSGELSKQTDKTLSGTLPLAGSLSGIRALFISLVGTLGLSGALTKQAQKPVDGTLPTSGSLTKQAQKVLGGLLPVSGALTGARLLLISLVGTLALGGALTKQVGKSLAGTLALSGGISKRIGKLVSGLLGFIGDLLTSGGTTNGPPILCEPMPINLEMVAMTLNAAAVNTMILNSLTYPMPINLEVHAMSFDPTIDPMQLTCGD